MAVEISGVTLRPSNDVITAASLGYPRTGPVDGHAFQVSGWVLSKAPVAEVEFIHEDIVVARCELTVSRPDVAKVYGSSSQVGFYKAIGTVGLAADFTIEVRVVSQDGRRDVIAEIRGTQQLSSDRYASRNESPGGRRASKDDLPTMDYVAKSRFSGDDGCQTTLLAEAVSVRRTPILGTVLYDRQSAYQRIRDYMPIETDFPQIFARHIPRAILTDYFIVHKDDAIFVDSSFFVVCSNGAKAPAIFETFAATLQQCDGTVDQRYADVSAMVFHNEGGGTWGHFIVQNLPRALLYLAKFPNGKIVLPSVQALPDATNSNAMNCYRSLVQLGVPEDRLLPVDPLVSYQFGELILVDFLYDFPKQIAHPLALDFLAAPAVPTDPPHEDRSMFVTRLPPFGRLIDNMAEVSAVASNHGVKTVLLGEQHFDAQRAAWRNSDLVVSTIGSDLTNIVFGKEGTRILALSPDWFGDMFFYNLAVMKGMQWNELRCGTRVQDADIPGQASFRVDAAILDVMLTSLARSPARDTTVCDERAGPMNENDTATATFCLPGVFYIEFLKALHTHLTPQSYLEVGTATGSSLALAGCDAIAVDPRFAVDAGATGKRTRTFFFQMTSDDFFATENAPALLGRPVDLAFLDGLHWFEFLLRDFISAEAACHPRSLILLHDCVPLNTRMALRQCRPGDSSEGPDTRGSWTGDVWKLLPILREYRPDLRLHVLDCPPTGLVAITRLDPASSVLADRYYEIVDQHAATVLDENRLRSFWDKLELTASRPLCEEPDRLTELFTLY